MRELVRARQPRICLLPLGVILCLAASPANVDAQVVRGPRSPATDSVFREWDRTDRPGAAVVVLRNGKILHMDGYGMADLDHALAIPPATVFDIASVSKHFTGWAVTRLEEAGKISLDDPIHLYLEEFDTFGQRITIRHLLHHVSGIRDWVELFHVAGWRFDDVITVSDIFTLAQHQKALNFQPGSEYAYSNTGFNLLAEIVARVSGVSFRQYMEENAFSPLGMTATHVHDRYNETVPQRARSYGPAGENGWQLLVNNTSAVGSSSVFTTVADMARWMTNLDRGMIGGQAVSERMLVRGVLNNGDTLAYGRGLVLGTYRGLRTVSHGGSWRGYRAHLLRFPDQKLSLAVFANFSTFNSEETALKVAEIYLGDLMGPGQEQEEDATGSSTFFQELKPGGPELSRRELAAYVGRYFSEELGTWYSIEIERDHLVARHRIVEERAMAPVGLDAFVLSGVRGQQRIRFIRDEGGQVTGYSLAGRRFQGILFQKMGVVGADRAAGVAGLLRRTRERRLPGYSLSPPGP